MNKKPIHHLAEDFTNAGYNATKEEFLLHMKMMHPISGYPVQNLSLDELQAEYNRCFPSIIHLD